MATHFGNKIEDELNITINKLWFDLIWEHKNAKDIMI